MFINENFKNYKQADFVYNFNYNLSSLIYKV